MVNLKTINLSCKNQDLLLLHSTVIRSEMQVEKKKKKKIKAKNNLFLKEVKSINRAT